MSYDFKLENGDLVLDSNGDLTAISDNDKLIQDLLKLLMTPISGNKMFPWYGSDVSGILIGSNYDLGFNKDVASEHIRSALDNIKSLQQEQAKSQYISPAETIVAVKDIYINTNATDQRAIEVKVTVITGALTKTDVRFRVKL